jgi:hypothetical protein
MLAEAENETYGNNATGIFSECFHVMHPQMPLALPDRLEVLRDLLAEHQPRERHLLAVQAIETALDHSPAVMLRRSEGMEPLGVRPSLTYGQIWDYIDELSGLLMQAARSPDSTVATAAAKRLPHTLATAALTARSESALGKFKTLVDWLTSGDLAISSAHTSDAIGRVREGLERMQDGAADDASVRLDALIGEAESLLHRLDKADYPARLKRWIGD